MSNPLFDQVIQQLEQLEAAIPGSVKENKELGPEIIKRFILPDLGLTVAPSNTVVSPKILDDPTKSGDDKTSYLNDDKMDLDSYWNMAYDCKMERPQKLREACRDAYAGKFGELPSQEGLEKVTNFGVKTFPAYMYPVTWLAEFLSSYRESFPIHWKNF